jgi:spore coat protein U-like protein
MTVSKTRINPLISLAVATFFSGAAMSATQGVIGATSDGDLSVTIEKGSAVKISKLDDIDFGVSNVMVVDAVQTEDFCVFSSTGTYAVTATSSNGTSGFEMANSGGSDLLAYEVLYGVLPMTEGVEIGGQLGDQIDEDCLSGVNNAAITLRIVAADFNVVAPGTYTDTLNLSVRPE